MGQSLWREMLYKELETLTVDGEVLDIGGSCKSGYHNLLKGHHTITVANLDDNYETDISFDLEKTFPIQDASYNNVLCINVLEHIYDYKNLLSESHRVLSADGVMIVAVPFLIRVHPSPNDYWRYTDRTLHKIFAEVGFRDIEIRPIGTGVFGASYSLRHNLYRVWLLQEIGKLCAKVADAILSRIGPKSSFTKKNYPLGYLVTVRK